MRKQRGITLVALIITIIILLILAGITVVFILGDNGVLEKAKQAESEYLKSAKQEEEELKQWEQYLAEGVNLPDNTENTQIGTIVKLPENWALETMRQVSTENGKDIVGTTKVATVYAVAIGDGKSIPVPYGFWYVGGDLNTGVIISDKEEDKYDGNTDKTTWEYTTKLKGNQFVWIPCQEEEYHKINWGNGNQNITNWYPSTPKAELIQIQKYGGFYAGRYEAGLAENIPESKISQPYESNIYNLEGIPQSKAQKIPWNCISYDYMKKNAEKMYQTNSVASGLITDTQWDMLINCIQQKEPDKTVANPTWGNMMTNSIPYKGRISNTINGSIMSAYGEETQGNTTNSLQQVFTTGSSKIAMGYHLYDIAGNLWEKTEDLAFLNNAFVTIDRGASGTDEIQSVCFRSAWMPKDLSLAVCTFRVVLYMK